MRCISLLIVLAGCLTAAAPTVKPPLSDTRLGVQTLVREDIFAGILDDDMSRLARGEKSIEVLLEQRPADRAELLVWKAGAVLYRAVRALEDKRTEEFEKKYAQAMDLLEQARKLGRDDLGVAAGTAGVYALLADRLPEKRRGPAWSRAYESYQALWKQQARHVERLPLHLRGELLGGLAQSAQRTGRSKELAQYLDKILEVAPDSAYARVARKWKDDPRAAASTRITCLGCHTPGRLAARQAALAGKSDVKIDPFKKELEKLAGTWQFVSSEKDGKPSPADEVKQIRIIIAGSKYTIQQAGKTVGEGTLYIDPTKKPRMIDIYPRRPEGKVEMGIYKWDGDEKVKMCFTHPGTVIARPGLFSTTRGTGHVMAVCKREKAK
jgi:uncharacterized protein (TIGR03067 family)